MHFSEITKLQFVKKKKQHTLHYICKKKKTPYIAFYFAGSLNNFLFGFQ